MHLKHTAILPASIDLDFSYSEPLMRPLRFPLATADNPSSGYGTNLGKSVSFPIRFHPVVQSSFRGAVA